MDSSYTDPSIIMSLLPFLVVIAIVIVSIAVKMSDFEKKHKNQAAKPKQPEKIESLPQAAVPAQTPPTPPPSANPAFKSILQKITAERGFSIFENIAKCKSLLADYTAGEFKKETRQLFVAIEAGCPGEIARSTEPEITRSRLINKLHNEFSMDKIAAEQIVILLYGIYKEEVL